jgi:mannose-6-phosphate isomerase-like protein (cupin superfamily)
VTVEERSLVIHIDRLPHCDTMDAKDLVNQDRSSIWTKHCYGEDISIRVAGRAGGYHSSPHIHDSEQLNYCAEGEMWIYVGNDGYRLRAGDLMRVPRNAVHWAWNRSDKPCVLYESHAPGNIGAPRVRDTAGPLFRANEPLPAGRYPMVSWLSTEYAEQAERADRPSVEGGLIAHYDEVKNSAAGIVSEGSGFRAKFVYGLQSSFLVATQDPGYRIRPHVHGCEQLMHIISGELWVFFPEEAYHLHKGDFMRVPLLTPHWSWNPGTKPCELFEAHAPMLDPSEAEHGRALLSEGETFSEAKTARTFWSPRGLVEREKDLMRSAEERK